MQFSLLVTVELKLEPQLQWIWYSTAISSFVVGDERQAFSIPVDGPKSVLPLEAAQPFDPAVGTHHPCNLPIPDSLYDEFAAEGWHGFRFLPSTAYVAAKDRDENPAGDLLRTLVYGPDYSHYVLHPASGMILSLRSGSMKLLCRTAEGFAPVDQTRTRGKAALAFAGHPAESLIVYGDNSGNFHAHRFGATGFGKASKIVAKERKASRAEFVAVGEILVVGGMGYLSTFKYEAGKFVGGHEVSIAVRDFLWCDDGKLVLVNQGLHGVSAYQFGEAGFTKLGEVKPAGGVGQMAVSRDSKYLAVTSQESASVSVFAIS
jgi:hypothetical protein